MKNILLTTALLALTTGAAAAQTVRLGTEGAYPPFNFINDAGEVAGFERDVGDEICKRAALTCEWVTNEWDSIIPNLQSGNYDVIIAGMSITEERDKVIDFSQNYFPPAASVYVATDPAADVATGVVSAQVGTIQAGHVAESGATLLEFATPDETVAAVRNGEAVAVFADKDFLAPIVAESNGELMEVGEPVQLGGGVGLGLRESDTELKAKFDAAIQSMKDDGSLNALIEKHFGPETAKF
ncbi:transporter substrate-binding domain-containing protein [Fertoebacter nigrum]|uniref:Transporter substrate-binding domain-containing protein n=1 Tax=Fertoeibacter niger TaxID=2656921 RepID=A0A8X8GZH8_9RHOB|nr:transporter substrate-binding domain-containing protein [Fertoeibacter niger]NUB44110.1 transporter substrate-binding domain-containing protein [Fertoeibacter niger]